MKTLLFYLQLLLVPSLLLAQNRDVSLQILSGDFMPVDSFAVLPVLGFADAGADSPEFCRKIIHMELGETLHLSIHNNHGSPHGFRWSTEALGIEIAAGDSAVVNFTPATTGAYFFYDDLDYPFNVARGLSGALLVKEAGDTTPDFVWFLNDHDQEWLIELAQGHTLDPDTYLADYFTINGNSFPATTTDTLASVVGQVDEPLNIWIINGGLQFHSIHFHGYHVSVLSHDGVPYAQPYSKDTIPVQPGVGLHTRLVPQQVGMYPVHDHSLSAVTAKGFYPNGMLILLDISENERAN